MKRAKHIHITEKMFKRMKRREFKKLREAIRDINLASAYLPHEAFVKLSKGMELIEESYNISREWWKNA